MSGKLYFTVLICILVFGGTASSSPVDQIGTIVLKSGETFETVHYKVNKKYRVITIKDGNLKKKVFFSDVVSIHSSEGVDISESILGIRRLSTPVEKISSGLEPVSSGGPWQTTGDTWQSEDSEVQKRARAKQWNIALSFKLGFDGPSGDFYDGVKGGVGFGGDIRIAVSNQLTMIGTVSLTGMDFDNSMILISPDPQVSILSQDFSMKATRFLVGIEYYAPLNRRQRSSGMWYFHSLIGAIKHNLSSDVTMRENVSGQVLSFSTSDNFTQFTSTIGGGVVPMLSPKVGLDLSGDLDLVWVRSPSRNNTRVDVSGYVFNIHAGLMFFL